MKGALTEVKRMDGNQEDYQNLGWLDLIEEIAELDPRMELELSPYGKLSLDGMQQTVPDPATSPAAWAEFLHLFAGFVWDVILDKNGWDLKIARLPNGLKIKVATGNVFGQCIDRSPAKALLTAYLEVLKRTTEHSSVEEQAKPDAGSNPAVPQAWS